MTLTQKELENFYNMLESQLSKKPMQTEFALISLKIWSIYQANNHDIQQTILAMNNPLHVEFRNNEQVIEYYQCSIDFIESFFVQYAMQKKMTDETEKELRLMIVKFMNSKHFAFRHHDPGNKQ